MAGAHAKLGSDSLQLNMLYAALDNVKSGLLILNNDMRAVYSNPALHKMFKSLSPEQIRQKKPRYSELLESARSASAVEMDNYVARRLAWVKSGNPAPTDLTMSDGKVLRCHVAILPDGGRMLTYSDVTDIVRNAQELERLATTDGMTGIYNRRHFLTLADREWSRAKRYRRPLSLLMIDIDFFKAINDTYGHQMGDRMISHLAGLARDCKRDTDVLARIGGEEFALLLPETTLDQANLVAERLRCEVAGRPLGAADMSVAATVSIGVAAADTSMVEFLQLMKAADQALYEAKRAGRNRVMCIARSMEPVDA
jgi:diguanylate cyclase (GGDEF)-like protein